MLPLQINCLSLSIRMLVVTCLANLVAGLWTIITTRRARDTHQSAREQCIVRQPRTIPNLHILPQLLLPLLLSRNPLLNTLRSVVLSMGTSIVERLVSTVSGYPLSGHLNVLA